MDDNLNHIKKEKQEYKLLNANNILSTDLPPNERTVKNARLIVSDRNVRIPELARILEYDPVCILETLKLANATFFAGHRPSITNIQTAIIRLGSQAMIDLLDNLQTREQIIDEDISKTFTSLFILSQRIARTSQIIAQTCARDITNIAYTTGSLFYIGHMVTCIYFGKEYADEAKKQKRNALAYRFKVNHGIDIQKMFLDYLRNRGVPQAILYGLDRNLKCKTPLQAALRFIVESASELVDAHKENRWFKYSPENQLPSKSALRLLQLSPQQYQQLYISLDFYFNPKNENAINSLNSNLNDTEIRTEKDSSSVYKIDVSKIDELNYNLDNEEKLNQTDETFYFTNKKLKEIIFSNLDLSQESVTYIDYTSIENTETSNLDLYAQDVLALIINACKTAKTPDELLILALQALHSLGPFLRLAVITLKNKRQDAHILMSVGDSLTNKKHIELKDPLSPLALCQNKTQSFNATTFQEALSPLGVSAFATSPLRFNGQEPVMLYADCGIDKPLPMTARKIFRIAVSLINNALSELQK